MFDEDLYSYVIDEMEPDTDDEGTSDDAYASNYIKKSFRLGHKKRKLSEIQQYEMTVEDKYGKIIKFDKKSDTIKIVEQGHQTDSDKEVDDDEPSKIKTSSSGYSKLNMILLLSVILMVI